MAIIYDYKAPNNKSEEMGIAQYRGKVLMIVLFLVLLFCVVQPTKIVVTANIIVANNLQFIVRRF